MYRRWLVGPLVGVLLAAGCTADGGDGSPSPVDPTMGSTSSTTPTTAAPETTTTTTEPVPAVITFQDGGFFGRVVRVEFGPDWRISPGNVAVTPGAISDTTVGPATLHFEDGTEVWVPPDTPGGNQCVELVRPEDWFAIAGLPDATLEQVILYGHLYDCFLYGALRADGSVAWFDVAEYTAGDPTARVRVLRRPIAMVSGLIVIEGDLGLAVSPEVTVICDPARTFDDWKADLEALAPRTRLEIDVSSGEVVEISCSFEF